MLLHAIIECSGGSGGSGGSGIGGGIAIENLEMHSRILACMEDHFL